jgi:HD-GYP domain-containing protein (c-di-GMP phosphodiesterase class II)
LPGDIIPLEAKIIAVADTFDAITSDRPYRKGASVHDAVKELQRVRGTQLDGEIIDVFVQTLKVYDVNLKEVCLDNSEFH